MSNFPGKWEREWHRLGQGGWGLRLSRWRKYWNFPPYFNRNMSISFKLNLLIVIILILEAEIKVENLRKERDRFNTRTS